ncbi:MAG: hypothetical protein WKF79_10290 [Nocardioides sp.]
MVAARAAAGRFAFVVVAGLGLGIVVGGVIGRLLMYLLVRLNDQARGLVSDDGFVMGQFTVSGSLSLLGVGAFLGTWGGLVYAGARHLTFGPAWFQMTSVALGAGLPVGAAIVHTEGVDFTVLTPPALSATLFVLLPASYGVLHRLVVERQIAAAPTSWHRLEPVRWLLRAGATGVLVIALTDLVGDLWVLT